MCCWQHMNLMHWLWQLHLVLRPWVSSLWERCRFISDYAPKGGSTCSKWLSTGLITAFWIQFLPAFFALMVSLYIQLQVSTNLLLLVQVSLINHHTVLSCFFISFREGLMSGLFEALCLRSQSVTTCWSSVVYIMLPIAEFIYEAENWISWSWV